MMFKRLCFLFPLAFCAPFAQGQEIKDSSLFITSIRAGYGAQFSGGDLADRFGFSNAIGLGVDVKTRKNLVFGLSGNYFFGNKVKEDILANMRNSDGEIIDQEGAYAKVLTYERGFTINAQAGYLFSVLSPNPNSGILLMGGVGYMQHKVRIEHNHNNVPALEGDYLKGYDRLTAGLCLSEFVGYQFLSNTRLANFFAGVQFYQGFTKSMRDWNIDQVKKDDSRRMDLITSLRIGWILPLYRRAPKEYYIY